jgi:DNA-3-methyladenine glycosylase I
MNAKAVVRRGAVRHADGKWRCAWCGVDPLYVRYHDTEWGVPLKDDERLLEMLCLEGAQAGLSWITVLRKREGYRRAFANFDPEKLIRFSAARRARLMHDPGIVRNRLKIESVVLNARAYLALREEHGSFADYLFDFAPTGRRRRPRYLGDLAPATQESDAMSRDLKRRGFKFVGSTICYAFMQATGMVNDHLTSCFRHREVARFK